MTAKRRILVTLVVALALALTAALAHPGAQAGRHRAFDSDQDARHRAFDAPAGELAGTHYAFKTPGA